MNTRRLDVSRVESFRIDSETHDKIEAAAREMGVRCSTLYRIIVKNWLQRRNDGRNE